MIECKKFKALIPESTCITRQKFLTSSTNNKFKGLYGGCLNCEIGLKLLKEDSKVIKEKTCKKCGKTHPATLAFFDPAPRASDRLTNLCSVCRAGDKDEQVPVAPVKPQARKSRKPAPGQERKVLIINIESSPGLWDALTESANENLRTPLAQALWILREALI